MMLCFFQVIFDYAGHGEFIPDYVLNGIHSVGPLSCGPSPLAFAVCGSAFFAIAGYDPCQINTVCSTQYLILFLHFTISFSFNSSTIFE